MAQARPGHRCPRRRGPLLSLVRWGSCWARSGERLPAGHRGRGALVMSLSGPSRVGTLVCLCWAPPPGTPALACGRRRGEVKGEGLVTQLGPTPCNPWTVAHQAPLSMGFSRQEYWSGLPFPSPGESSQPRDRTQVSRIVGRYFNL